MRATPMIQVGEAAICLFCSVRVTINIQYPT
jgi:hypothetical protein